MVKVMGEVGSGDRSSETLMLVLGSARGLLSSSGSFAHAYTD